MEIVAMDLLTMWIDGQYDELFAVLKAMKPAERNKELSYLASAMVEFDDQNREAELNTGECDRFWAEVAARLS